MERTAVVLAGGFSTRFGQDKAVVALNGKPLITHVIETVRPIVDEVVVVTSDKERASQYSKLVNQSVKFAVDLEEAQGPLVGALTGFEVASGAYSLLLPADTPFVSCEVIDLFFDLCHGKSAVIPRWPNQQIEPLHAVYQTKNALAAARLAVDEGLLNVRAMIERLRGVRYVSTLVIQELDPELRTFFNVNTPLDLRMAEGLLKRRLSRRRT
jgi:molybdopterin-guanine dinucleotide biosynthesis protein A